MTRYFFALVFCWLLPFLLSAHSTLSGSIPFWHDPGRDLTLALDNLKKPSLLGAPTGIPGIFYGPFWIWLISLVQIVTRDPRYIAFILLLVPYFTLGFYLFFRLRKYLGTAVSLCLWLLFSLTYNFYTNFIWNPHIAPLLVLLLATIVLELKPTLDARHILLQKVLTIGLVSGLLINFHFSFGLGIFFGATIFLITTTALAKNWRLSVVTLPIFLIGASTAFLPTILFEIRHGFSQLRNLVWSAINSTVFRTPAVGTKGMWPPQIAETFFNLPAEVLSLPPIVAQRLLTLPVILALWDLLYLRKPLLSWEKRLLSWTALTLGSLMTLFLTTANSVWKYHFIGFEIIIILFLGLLANRYLLIRFGLYLLVVALAVKGSAHFLSSLQTDPTTFPSLASQQKTVTTLLADAANTKYYFFAYDPAIYTYHYDYLITWLIKEKYHHPPEPTPNDANNIYLIIPQTEKAVFEDFINYRTPNTNYATVQTWPFPDGTTLLKRQRNRQE